VQATFHHVPQLSGNGREDTGRKVDTNEMDKETSGTGLTTTKIGSSQSEPNEKEGARDCGEEIERVEDKKGMEDRVRGERKAAKPTLKCC
jgi:hypothetical protein